MVILGNCNAPDSLHVCFKVTKAVFDNCLFLWRFLDLSLVQFDTVVVEAHQNVNFVFVTLITDTESLGFGRWVKDDVALLGEMEAKIIVFVQDLLLKLLFVDCSLD